MGLSTWLSSEGTMSDEGFSELRQGMLAEIAAHAIFACARLGKAALSRRVLDVMAKVPRHEFVPVELRPYAYARRSRSEVRLDC
jgi:protein-L-isoaspartate(D-aspartate) O-methyltransferase